MPLILYGATEFRIGRVQWMLEELDIKYVLKPIGPRTGETQTDEFRQINPRGKIPALVDGNLCLAESVAINTYLCDRYGEGKNLIPKAGTPERALHDMWQFFAVSELDSQSLYLHRKHIGLKQLYGDAPAADILITHCI